MATVAALQKHVFPESPSLEGPSPTLTVDLDTVPLSRLPSFIQALCNLLGSHHRSAVLTFTTRGPILHSSVGLQNDYFVAAAVPFLPRRHVSSSQHKLLNKIMIQDKPPLPAPYHLNRTAMSLELTLPLVLATLTASTSTPKNASRTLDISLVRNVSAAYAKSLCVYSATLEEEKTVRQAFISTWGEDGWREERFLATWEAAATREGLLARWMVVVQM